jgi:uncharacterized zinc-type alcohol dehydrogenase-like protein
VSAIRAYAVPAAGKPLEPFSYEPAPLGRDQVEIAVSHCGVCHSDLSMANNDWGNAVFPLVPGHEIVGRVVAAGDAVRRVKVGDRVGLGWFAGSCMSCPSCLSGNHNLCGTAEQTIVGRHGGFADRVRANWEWATPLPDNLDEASAGPLFCGGITVFAPILNSGLRPTDRAGVVGIGGLGHLAIKFLAKWGCEVVALTSSASKQAEAIAMGAHSAVDSRNPAELARLVGSLDFLLVTANVPMDWNAMLAALAPKGRLHFVGAVLEPIPVPAFALISGQKMVSGSPLGSPHATALMLDFCARHQIAPTIEMFPMSQVNDALEHLRDGKARYRIVLKNDFPQ